MTIIGQNTNSLASFFNEKAKAIINNVGKSNQKSTIENFMVQEQDAQNTNSPLKPEAAQQTSENGCGGSVDNDYIIRRAAIPGITLNLTYSGNYDKSSQKARGELQAIVDEYFTMVKEQFGCETRDYMPYMYGVAEYDQGIAKEMEETLRKMVLEDPKCVELTRKMGGVFPPPYGFDEKLMNVKWETHNMGGVTLRGWHA